MSVQPRVYRGLSSRNTSLETSSSSDRNPLRPHLHTLGLTALADKVERCCTHFRVLASRQAWADEAALASACHRVTHGHGTVVDIRDREADVRPGLCWTLMYPFKPPNLAAWGPAQVARFTTLGRRKLAECYGVLRGLAPELAEESEEADA
jgi:hypothetical protein